MLKDSKYKKIIIIAAAAVAIVVVILFATGKLDNFLNSIPESGAYSSDDTSGMSSSNDNNISSTISISGNSASSADPQSSSDTDSESSYSSSTGGSSSKPESSDSTSTESSSSQSESSTVEPQLKFRNKKLLNEHYQKHGIDMGFASAEEYEKAAARVPFDPNVLHKIEADDGDDVYYIESTNEFVVVSKDGYLRTYFNPDRGIDYFNRQ